MVLSLPTKLIIAGLVFILAELELDYRSRIISLPMLEVRNTA